jgi:hypothetical protein
MEGNKSDYLENKQLDHVYGGGDYTRPATVYLALFTVIPVDTGSGGTEVNGINYVRFAITNNATNFPPASGGTKSNGTVLTFPTAGGTWGTIVAFGLYDASSSGNLLHYGKLTSSKLVGINETVSFDVGALVITED